MINNNNNRFISLLLMHLLLLWMMIMGSVSWAGPSFQGDLGLETTVFPETGQFGQDSSRFSLRFAPSLTWYPEAKPKWVPGYIYEYFPASVFVFSPYARWDSMDEERTHLDVREAYWLLQADYSELTIGAVEEFWGKMEFANLVDVINQRDFIDDISGREKLGQPMIRFKHLTDRSEWAFYVLVDHREAAFPSESGRFRLPLPIDPSRSNTEHEGDLRGKLDFAVRWSGVLGNDRQWGDIAISYFNGVSRQPLFGLTFQDAEIVGTPIYPRIEQWGLEWEWLYEGWALKLESVVAKDSRLRHGSAAAGVEYTWGNIFQSGHDVTVILEYIYDNRQLLAPTFTEQDWVFGVRWSENDVQSTEWLVGFVWDTSEDEQLFSVEYSFRWREHFEWIFGAQKAFTKSLPPVTRIDSSESFLAAVAALDLTEDQLAFLTSQAADLVVQIDSGDDSSIGFENEAFVDSISQFVSYAPAAFENKLSIYERDSYVRAELRYYW